MKCSKCGTELENGVSFCKECGAKVITSQNYCSKCGAKLEENAKFCSSCGASVTSIHTNKVQNNKKINYQKQLTDTEKANLKIPKKNFLYAIIVAVLLLLIILLPHIFRTSYSNKTTSTNETTSSQEEASIALPEYVVGTYVGENKSVLTFFGDGTADYYYQPDYSECTTNHKWRYENNKIIWMFSKDAEIYANISNNNVSLLYFQCDNPLKWTNEKYNKVSDIATHWTTNECDQILLGNIPSDSSPSNALVSNSASSEAVQPQKDIWDLTGSWCEDSVSEGLSGMAAFISDSEITVFWVSDNSYIRTPFWIGTYETEVNSDSFSWTSYRNENESKKCPYHSQDDEKVFNYNNGVLTFSSSLGEKSLTRSDIDFSVDYHETPLYAESSTCEVGGIILNIPKSFGLFSKETKENSENLRYISSDGILIIQYLKDDKMDTTKLSDSKYVSYFDTATKSIIDGMAKKIDNYEILEDKNLEKGLGLAHTCTIKSSSDDSIDSYTYIGTIGIKELNTFITILMQTNDSNTSEYASNYEKIIKNTKITKEANTTVALAPLTSQEDKISQTTFYKPASYPEYTNIRSFVLPYISVKNGVGTLHLKANYYGNDWVFWDTLIFAIDEERYEMKIDLFDSTDTDVDGRAKVVENYDFCPLEDTDIKILDKIIKSKETIIRFKGNNKYYDMTITEEDKQAIKDIVTAYRNLN
ncbi:zinc ribbon domain-containing protein [Butyrivibrio hungatei]|uniref:DZANK-type domain-containing protein n=1 Tax=Butyrivibrio hungatei TaxID=185008 RepID=A0A1D9P162_9FIRM|nr:zinc ribbon domain-containing protein [Butyrivibrio hungatei]AOZ96219.1 hypothetical protein bhn_I1185 [Butyrivibrio hungatei]